MKRIVRITLLVLISVNLACENEEAYQAQVDQAIQKSLRERIAEYEKSKRAECESRALEIARNQADSIILAEARLTTQQKPKPPKPEKPDQPELKTLSDTAALKPVLSDSLRSSDTNALNQ